MSASGSRTGPPASSAIRAISSPARRWQRKPRSKPEILLVHGEVDEILPVAATRYAENMLRKQGFAVNAVYRPGLGHGIDEEGLRRGAAFLRRILGA